MIYALLDGQKFIGPEHLEAALAVGAYCEASARFIFSGRESNPCARKILQALREGPKSTTDLYAVFKRKLKAEQLRKAINELIAQGKIEVVEEKTGSRPRQVFRLAAV